MMGTDLVAGKFTDDDPPDDKQLSVPDALVEIEDLISKLTRFIQRTQFLTMPIETDDGERQLHPGQFTLGNMKKIRTSLVTEYGEEMWTNGEAWTQKLRARSRGDEA